SRPASGLQAENSARTSVSSVWCLNDAPRRTRESGDGEIAAVERLDLAIAPGMIGKPSASSWMRNWIWLHEGGQLVGRGRCALRWRRFALTIAASPCIIPAVSQSLPSRSPTGPVSQVLGRGGTVV